MTTSNSTKINVDTKLKERLKMFEEIDKMVKIDKLNPSNSEIKEDLSHLDNSSLYNYSEKCLSKIDEAQEKNFNLPMQSNKFKKNAKQEIPFNNQKHCKQALVLNSESDKGFSKYQTNSNYVESTNELKSMLPTPDNESVYKREKEKLVSGNDCNNNINNENVNLSFFEENKIVNSNFNLYKKNKISNTKLPHYSSKSPQKRSENLSDFDNNAYDFPQQISKKTNKEATIKKNYIDLNSNNKKNKNSYANPYKNKANGVNNNNYLASNQIENPFHKNISNELNLHSDRNSKAKSDNNIKRNYDSYTNQGKSSSKVSLSTYENTCINTNQKANNIRKEVKKDFVECFEYDFYNFPLIKNIPDSKIYGTDQPNKAHEQIKNLNRNNFNNNNYNYSSLINQNQINYNTPRKDAITNFISKNSTNGRNRNLDEFLNTNKTKNTANSNKRDPNSSKNINKTFEISNSKPSMKSQSRSISKSRNNRKSNSSISNDPENKRLKNLKKFIMNSKEPNFGERLYNYNFYLNEKLNNRLEQENKQRVRSATPSITRKAKNLQRNGKDFHLRLYPYSNKNVNNCENSKLNSSSDIAFCGKENRFNSNENYDNTNQEQGTNEKFQGIYDDFTQDDFGVNVVFDKNFIQKGLYHGENFAANKPKRSLSSHNLLGGSFIYNQNNFGKKNFEDQNMNFQPKLNKKSLEIASKFGPAIERLYPKKGIKTKQMEKLQKLEKQNNHSHINTPKSYFSNLSVISKRSISPLLHKNSNLYLKRNNSCTNNKDAVKRQHELYNKGLEKIKIREEISKEKIQTESETYKQFSYRPKINTKFTSNIISGIIYKTPKNIPSTNNNNNNNSINTKNIQDETLKFDVLENNLIGSPTTNLNFNSIQQNMNSEDLNFNDFSVSKHNPNNKSDISAIEKFQHIYEKNLIWKKKIENQAEKIKTSEEKKRNENLTFKPQINKIEMQNDEKFIEKNLEQINDYVNKRRANLKKQKEDEDFIKSKFNFGQNFVIKPTIPQEFNLHAAKKKSSEKNKNNFNRSNINNVSRISSNSNINYASEVNKSPLRRINNNANEFIKSGRNANRHINNFNNTNSNNAIVDSSNVNASNVNSIRNELKIEDFFSSENNIDFEDDENQQNYLDHIERFNYYGMNDQQQLMQNYHNSRHQRYMASNNNYDNNIKYYNNNSQNLSYNSQKDYNTYSNDRRKSFSRDKRNNKTYNNLECIANQGDNLFSNVKHNSHYVNKNEFIGYHNKDLSNQQINNESQKDQIEFVNAINNLHEKLVNLNI